MKTRQIIGKSVLRVEQERFWNEHADKWDVDVKQIMFDDGTFIVPITLDRNAGYAHDFCVDRMETENPRPKLTEDVIVGLEYAHGQLVTIYAGMLKAPSTPNQELANMRRAIRYLGGLTKWWRTVNG